MARDIHTSLNDKFVLIEFSHKKQRRAFLLQLSMAAPRAWRKSGQDVGWVFTCPVAPSLLSSSAGETTRSASPGVNTRSVARLVGVAFLSTSALVHLPFLPYSGASPGKQAATNHCLPDALAPPTPRKTSPHLGDNKEGGKQDGLVDGILYRRDCQRKR